MKLRYPSIRLAALWKNRRSLVTRDELCLRIFMASLLPPPKRVKVNHGRAPPIESGSSDPSLNVVVHFVSEDNGQSLAPSVNLPSNITRDGLEEILNKLTGKVNLQLSLISPTISQKC
jgi:hypothetical protein